MKALVCGAAMILRSIRLIDDPFRIKALARKIVATKEWEEQRNQILYEIVKAKFLQNPEYTEALLATKKLEIYEATRDLHYGCGLPLSQAFQMDKKSPGKNVYFLLHKYSLDIAHGASVKHVMNVYNLNLPHKL